MTFLQKLLLMMTRMPCGKSFVLLKWGIDNTDSGYHVLLLEQMEVIKQVLRAKAGFSYVQMVIWRKNMKNRPVGLWSDWMLIHLGGCDYELLKISGGKWVPSDGIHAVDDTDACNQTEWLIATADQAED